MKTKDLAAMVGLLNVALSKKDWDAASRYLSQLGEELSKVSLHVATKKRGAK